MLNDAKEREKLHDSQCEPKKTLDLKTCVLQFHLYKLYPPWIFFDQAIVPFLVTGYLQRT